MGRAGAILLTVGYAAGVLLVTAAVPESHPVARIALLVFASAACLVGAGLATAAFARISLRHYKARAERRAKREGHGL